MAQEELRLHHRHQRRAVMTGLATLLLGAASACQAVDKPVGLTLLFMNKGSYAIGVTRFDPDGQRGPVPGGLGAGGGGAQMTFMPGDSKRGLPQFVEIAWVESNADVVALQDQRDKSFELYSRQWLEETKKINLITPKYNRHLDLTSILTPELVAQARTNPKTTN